MIKVTFLSAKQEQSQINGFSVDFTINYFKKIDGLYKDIDSNHRFKVTITQWALSKWRANESSQSKPQKIFFNQPFTWEDIILMAFPFAVELISERVRDSTLKEFEEIIISTNDIIGLYPYDLQKINKIEGYEIIFDNENIIDVGKRIQTNIMADSIIELRDNINALIYSKNHDNLLKLVQERNILTLFRQIDNKEQFTYAISTLGNLVNDLNSVLLKKITGNRDENVKSFTLLDQFLKSIDDKPNHIVEIFRTINRIRQGFPIHTDKAGIIENLQKFNISYPIVDHNEVWLVLLGKYKEGLAELLEIIKKYYAI